MFEISLELNRILTTLDKLSDSIGKIENPKICDITDENKLSAAIDFIKGLELTIRSEEIIRHMIHENDVSQLKASLSRLKPLSEELASLIGSLTPVEKRIISNNLQSDFLRYQKKLKEVLKKRPSNKMWDKDSLTETLEELMGALESLRRGLAHATLYSATSVSDPKYIGDLVC